MVRFLLLCALLCALLCVPCTVHTLRTALLELRRKFEEDKQRIQLVKAQRKFKPM